MSVRLGTRPAPPPTRARSRNCQVYQYIGQRYDCCDGCGLPRREHLYDSTVGDQRPDLYVKQPGFATGRWEWVPAKVLRRGDR